MIWMVILHSSYFCDWHASKVPISLSLVIGIDYFDPVFSLMCFIGLNGEKGEKESGS